MDTPKELQDAGNLDNIQSDLTLFGDKIPRLSVMSRVGFAPISIWKPDWNLTRTLKGWVGDAGQTRELQGKKMALMGSKYTTSIFNPHLAQMILSAYVPEKQAIFDPFAGGGTRGFIAAAMGHSYVGVDIRCEEVDRLNERKKELGLDKIFFHCWDSQTYPVLENAYDFAYTCPPYYDLEVYSSLQGDMSNVASYGQFLEMLKNSMITTYNGLKPGALFVMVVGNFRDKKGNLRHFNGDTVRLGTEVGFVLHDELIFHGASDAAYQRLGQFEANRRSVRVHEYILIFKKP
jgi:16S rRNA G966 N2-methylase RsmD